MLIAKVVIEVAVIAEVVAPALEEVVIAEAEAALEAEVLLAVGKYRDFGF